MKPWRSSDLSTSSLLPNPSRGDRGSDRRGQGGQRPPAAFGAPGTTVRQGAAERPLLARGSGGLLCRKRVSCTRSASVPATPCRWPDAEEVEPFRRALPQMERVLAEELSRCGLDGDMGFTHACLHEEVMVHLHAGRTTDVRRVAEQLLKLRPGFVPVMNNMAEACFAERDFTIAIETSRQVLALEPDNAYARGNLIVSLFFTGRQAKAIAEAERLKKLKPETLAGWVKTAEALSYLGDDAGVLSAVESARKVSNKGSPAQLGVAEHLAAVALYRVGREPEARSCWRQAIEYNPSLTAARQNLEELGKPLNERDAGWAFPTPVWVSIAAMEEYVRRVARHENPESAKTATLQFLDSWPNLQTLIPVMLDRGNPIAVYSPRKLLEARTRRKCRLHSGLSVEQCGPDSLRMQAAEHASSAGVIPGGPVRMWLGGEWREIEIPGSRSARKRRANSPNGAPISSNERTSYCIAARERRPRYCCAKH